MSEELEELEELEANDSVSALPTLDNDDDDDDPRETYSRLTPDQILQLTRDSQASSMIASGSTLISFGNDEKAKSQLDSSMNIRKLDPPSHPVNGQTRNAGEQGIPAGKPSVSLSAGQVLALSEGNMMSSSTKDAASKNARNKRNTRAAKKGLTKQRSPAATVIGATASSTNNTGLEKKQPSSASPLNNDGAEATRDFNDSGSSAFMGTPGAYEVEGLASTSSCSDAPRKYTPSKHGMKNASLVMASAIDRDALKEELRQELLAEQQPAAQVVMAVPAGNDEDFRDSINTETSQTRSSNRRLSASNRKWWILLAVAALLVGVAIAGRKEAWIW